MKRHVIKLEYEDGKKLQSPIVWCGREVGFSAWLFQDAQHVALSVGGSVAPCKNCIKAIISELSKELTS